MVANQRRYQERRIPLRINVNEEHHAQLLEIAKDDSTSLSSVARRAIEYYLNHVPRFAKRKENNAP